jgi:hypothetical protein
MPLRRGHNRTPRPANQRKTVATGSDWHRNLVGVVSRVVPVRMAGMLFLGPTVGMAVAVVNLLSRQRGMTL